MIGCNRGWESMQDDSYSFLDKPVSFEFLQDFLDVFVTLEECKLFVSSYGNSGQR